MWSDNETKDDLLGFQVHSELIRDVVTDPALLPVVIGVFGDWGGGKSSIMQMLKADLDQQEGVACLYFNGWVFEGFEDAKAALLKSILMELGEHKRYGPKLREGAASLLKRVQWMEMGKQAVKYGPSLAAGITAIGAVVTGHDITTFLPALLAPGALSTVGAAIKAANEPKEDKEKDGKKDDKGKEDDFDWLNKILAAPGKPDLMEVRKFRSEFEKLLAQTDMKSLVILIDDLDRCLPDRIIDTLEAIKLFVAVPKTAFVIGADERIVRHAVVARYTNRHAGAAGSGDQYDPTNDYIEKLIQIPYHLPRLSPTEVETYINLLLCQQGLDEEGCTKVVQAANKKRSGDFYTAFGHRDIHEALSGATVSEELTRQIAWSNSVAVQLTEGLKGNPRQVKRMLNAMILRTKLAKVAKLDVRPNVLAKLMVLEYTAPHLFRRLDEWQTVGKGFAEPLRSLEREASEEAGLSSPGDEVLADWRKPAVRNWLALQPLLSDTDLRDYFWVARDRTRSTLTGANMVPTHIRRWFNSLIGDNPGARISAVREAVKLPPDEVDQLLGLLGQQLVRQPDRTEAAEAFASLAEAGLEGAVPTLLRSAEQLQIQSMAAGIATRLGTLAKKHPAHRDALHAALQRIAGGTGPAAAAAKIELKDGK